MVRIPSIDEYVKANIEYQRHAQSNITHLEPIQRIMQGYMDTIQACEALPNADEYREAYQKAYNKQHSSGIIDGEFIAILGYSIAAICLILLATLALTS